jgi:predicted ATP-dependent endonuclease of OLD family
MTKIIRNIFSRLVILVEGDTEVGALPIFADRSGKNLDSLGISIVGAGGKNFVNYIRVISLFDIPYLVMCDADTLKDVDNTIDLDSQEYRTSYLFLQLQKLSLLTNDEKLVLKECETLVDRINELRCNTEKCEKRNIEKLYYNQNALGRLYKIAKKYGFFVLSSDFEHLISDRIFIKRRGKNSRKVKDYKVFM